MNQHGLTNRDKKLLKIKQGIKQQPTDHISEEQFNIIHAFQHRQNYKTTNLHLTVGKGRF